MFKLGDMQAKLSAGRMNRRDFMQFALATGVSLTAADALYAQTLAATPKRGGSARFGLAHGATTDTLDPASYSHTGTMTPFWGAMSNSLTEVDVNGDITLDLLESMEPSDGAKTWVCKLKKGIQFHDGKDLTVDDVIASFRYHMGPNTKSSMKAVLSSITEIKADGPETIKFTLASGNADFPYICSDYHLAIVQANSDGSANWQNTARTGPFIFESWQPGVQAVLKRNPNYHKPGLPYFDDVTFLTINDVAARTNALMTGEVDWISRCDLKTVDLLARRPNITITNTPSPGFFTFPMMMDVKPFDDNNVRLALKHAIDREEIIRKIFRGYASIGNDTPIAPSLKYAINPAPQHQYDVEKSKFYLKKAGLSSLKVDLNVADVIFNGCVDTGLLYQQSAKAAGIDINVVREPDDGYFDNVWLKKPWSASYWAGRPTIDWLLTLQFVKGVPWNETHFDDPNFDELLLAARSELDEGRRANMYADLQQTIHDNSGALTPIFTNYVDAHSSKLAHGKIASSQECDGLRIAERWWNA